MTSPRSVVVAGAGIGGLTAALALAAKGFRVVVAEQAERLEAVGAGLQLSPNASRVLIALGLGEALKPAVVAPTALNVMNARTGQVLARAELDAEARYGAPYWVAHRGDLHTVLHQAVARTPTIALELGLRVEDFTRHNAGITVAARRNDQTAELHGSFLIGADGLWSVLRGRLGHRQAPHFARHSAWRTLVPADVVLPAMRAPSVNLWLGRHAHLVHYPVRGGSLINVVAILRDDWQETGWSAPGVRDEIVSRFVAATWHPAARELIGTAEHWLKWALFDCRPFRQWGTGPVTLIGDAAHPMLPFLAQGAAMAIEDAAVLADCLAATPDETALRRYEQHRLPRTARTQRAARRNGVIYHMGGAEAFLRTLALMAMRGSGLLRHYDWLYRWQPPR